MVFGLEHDDYVLLNEAMNRRQLLRGLFATPAIVAASSLMPVRGIIMPVGSPFREVWSQMLPVLPIAPKYDCSTEEFIAWLRPKAITYQVSKTITYHSTGSKTATYYLNGFESDN